MKKIVFTIALVLLVFSCASIPEISSEQAVSDPGDIISGNKSNILIGEKTDLSLTKADPVIEIPNPKYYSPYDCLAVDVEAGIYEIELISLGNMFGFKKSIMVPLIAVINKEGEEVKINPTVYEVRKNTFLLPVHLYSKWELNVIEKQKIYLIIYADMSSTDNIMASAMGMFGVIPFNLTLPLNRSAFAKYSLTIQKK